MTYRVVRSGWVALLIVAASCRNDAARPEVQLPDSTISVKLPTAILGPDEMVPDSLRVSGPFQMRMAPTSVTRTLGQMCASCASLHQSLAPRPAFADSFDIRIPLPVGIDSVRVLGGNNNLWVEYIHNWSFYVPAEHCCGHFAQRVPGTNASWYSPGILPAGLTFRSVGQLSSSRWTDSIMVRIHVVVPTGDATRIDTTQHMRVTLGATSGVLKILEAIARPGNTAYAFTESWLPLDAVDAALLPRVKNGALVLDIENTFRAGANVTLNVCNMRVRTRCEPGSSDLTIPFTIRTGSDTVSIDLTTAQMQWLLQNRSRCSQPCERPEAVLLRLHAQLLATEIAVRTTDHITANARLNVRVAGAPAD